MTLCKKGPVIGQEAETQNVRLTPRTDLTENDMLPVINC
jgi:hypothetical protein